MTERCAGVLIPLFSLRSEEDFGRGEFGGLVPMSRFVLAMGHRLVQLLPIDELAPSETSPYSALSVFALDPIYISVHLLPGVDRRFCAAARAELRANTQPLDQLRVRTLKHELLLQSYRHFLAAAGRRLRDEYRIFEAAQRGWLDDYALFRALKQELVAEWESWPEPLKQRQPKALAEASRKLAGPIGLLKYVQFAAHRQWAAIRARLHAADVMVGGDLAFSPCRESAEVWAHQDLFDLHRSVGAPPDAFAINGQRWGLPMPNWRQMRAGNFDFMRMRVRHARQLFDLLRIDHVVGLYRTWGYPMDEELGGEFDPAEESAQRAQGEEILRIVQAEAGSMTIVAEDLGVIPQFVRATLAALAIPGYKVMRWEKTPLKCGDEQYIRPADYPPVSLATTGTHDTETLIEWWAHLGGAERQRFARSLGFGDGFNWQSSRLEPAALDAMLEPLYASPAQLVVMPIQDLMGWEARINLPGTISETNWSWRLPFELEGVTADAALCERLSRLRALCERTGRINPSDAE